MNDAWRSSPGQITPVGAAVFPMVDDGPEHVHSRPAASTKTRAAQATHAPVEAALPWELDPRSPRIDRIGLAESEEASERYLEPRCAHCDEVLAPAGAARFRAALTIGALTAALGLGWIGGSSMHGFFAGDPPSPPFGTRTSGREATPRQPNASKAAAVAETKADRGHGASPRAARQAIPSTNPTATSAQQDTSPPRPGASAADRRAKLLPVPETRPTTIPGWGFLMSSAARSSWKGPTASGR